MEKTEAFTHAHGRPSVVAKGRAGTQKASEASDGRAGLYMGVVVELYLGAVSAVCESGRGAGEDEGGRDGRG